MTAAATSLGLFAVQLALLLLDRPADYLPWGRVRHSKLILSPGHLKTLKTDGGGEGMTGDLHRRFKCPSAKIGLRYAAVLDAGSTGTRVHVYEFAYCQGHMLGLAGELFHEAQPGLSAFASEPLWAWRTLRPIVESARRVVRGAESVPVVLCATAGMRLVASECERERVLHESSLYLSALPRPFELVDVRVISGGEEAVMAWLTVNFLRGIFSFAELLHHRQSQFDGSKGRRRSRDEELLSLLVSRTSTTIDLGGASTQIVFAVDHVVDDEDHYYWPLETRHGTMHLYRHSHLGYGMLEARKRIRSADLTGVCGNDFNWDACCALVHREMFTSGQCARRPCNFGNVHQPAVNPKSPVIAASFLSSTIRWLYSNDNEDELETTVGKVESLAISECKGTRCLDLAYIVALLKTGYGLGSEQKLVLAEEIAGFQMSWSLGVALELLADCDSQ